MFLNGRNDKLMDASGIAFGMSSLAKQTDFRIASCPVAQPIKPGRAFLIPFQPDKGHGLEGEAPCLNQPQGLPATAWGKRGPTKNSRQSLAASVSTGRAHSSSIPMVG